MGLALASPASRMDERDGRRVKQDAMSSGLPPEPATLRPGDRILVDGRQALLVYLWQSGAVVRYHGEQPTRVVTLRKIQRAG